MITFEQLVAIKGALPVLLADGGVGLVIGWSETEAMIQVPDEEESRFIRFEHLSDVGNGALQEENDATKDAATAQ